MRKLRILFLIGSMREGGAEGQLLLLMRGLRARGHEVALMLLHYEGTHLQSLLDEGFVVYPVHLPRFRPRWSPLPWFQLPLAWWRAVREARRFRPDVMHAMLFWSHLWAWLLLSALGRVRFVTSRLQTWTRASRPPLHQWIEDRINRRADLVIANSRIVARSCLRHERHLRGKIRVIYNGLDLERIDSAASLDLRHEFPALADASQIAINVASLLPLKGHKDLLEAWARVVRSHPLAKLLCVGPDGGEQERLRQQVVRLGLADHIVFAGARRDVVSLVKGADLAIQASRDEGMSVALLEYMACGKPIVATDVGGTREAIKDGVTGLLVPCADPGGLADAILRMVGEQALTAGMGADRRRYSMEWQSLRHERAYLALVV